MHSWSLLWFVSCGQCWTWLFTHKWNSLLLSNSLPFFWDSSFLLSSPDVLWCPLSVHPAGAAACRASALGQPPGMGESSSEAVSHLQTLSWTWLGRRVMLKLKVFNRQRLFGFSLFWWFWMAALNIHIFKATSMVFRSLGNIKITFHHVNLLSDIVIK